MDDRGRISALARVFAWIGTTAIGGGRSAHFHDAVVVRRRWLTDGEFPQSLTLSQLLPGPNFSNPAVALGQRPAGATGAACGLLAVLVPGGVAILGLAVVYFGRGVVPDFGAAPRGMGAAVSALLVLTTLRLMRGAAWTRGARGIAVVTFLAVGPLRLNTLLVILVVGAAGLWMNRPRRLTREAMGDRAPGA